MVQSVRSKCMFNQHGSVLKANEKLSPGHIEIFSTCTVSKTIWEFIEVYTNSYHRRVVQH